MKKLIFVLSLGLMIGMVNINRAEAQVSININIDVQPAWGPSGFDFAEFYYIPEIDIYYDVINGMFYYHQRGRWRSSRFLPVAYSYYDFYSLYKVVLNGVHRPWKYNRRHRSLYAGYRHNYVQIPIFYMKEPRYQRARSNYHGWVEPRHMPRNNGRPANREYSASTPRNGRISNDVRSSGSNNRSSSVNNNRSSSTDNNRSGSVNNNRNNSTNNNRSSRNESTMNNRSSDKRESNVTTNGRSSSTRSSVSSENNTKKKNASTSSRSSESKSSRSTKEEKSSTSRSGRR